jgi:hypothetical protein
VVTVVDACALGSVSAFLNAAINEARAALPAGEFMVAAAVVSRATYPFKAVPALAVDSVCSGSRTATTPALSLLMVAQSATDGSLAERVAVEVAAVEVAGVDATGLGEETGAEVTVAVGVELDDELDEVQPAMRAPLAASTAKAESDERLDISGTSMGVKRGRFNAHAQAAERLPIAVVRPGVACAGVSLLAFSSAAMNEATAALPPGEVSWACWVLSVARYAFKVAAALAVDSLASGVSVAMTPELILLMIAQSAVDGLLAELAAVEVADADATGVGEDTGAEVAVAVGVELDDELDELQPAMRAPLAASTAKAESDERLDISGTSMEWNGALHLMRIWFYYGVRLDRQPNAEPCSRPIPSLRRGPLFSPENATESPPGERSKLTKAGVRSLSVSPPWPGWTDRGSAHASGHPRGPPVRSITVIAGVMLVAALAVPTAASATSAAPAARTAPASSSPRIEHPLFDVSCASPKYCIAVGYDERADGGDGGPIAETWNGRTWSVKSLKVPAGTSGGALFGVACKSQKSCVAVGDAFLKNDNTAALTELWNGKTWTAARAPVPSGTTTAALNGVSCVTSADCVATGVSTRANGVSAGLADTWNGRKWSDVSVKLPAGSASGDLAWVSCASSKSCVTVGSYANAKDNSVMLAASWNGRTWTTTRPPASASATSAALQGVSCPSSADCVAVGWYTRPGGGSFGLAESWNGKKWTEVAVPKSPGNGALYNVSCVSAKYCLAVGDGGAPGNSQGTPSSDVWNGKSWAFKHVPVPAKGGGSTAASTLQGASCLSATDCVAVGELDLGNGEQQQYGFSGFWNGKSWRLAATA